MMKDTRKSAEVGLDFHKRNVAGAVITYTFATFFVENVAKIDC